MRPPLPTEIPSSGSLCEGCYLLLLALLGSKLNFVCSDCSFRHEQATKRGTSETDCRRGSFPRRHRSSSRSGDLGERKSPPQRACQWIPTGQAASGRLEIGGSARAADGSASDPGVRAGLSTSWPLSNWSPVLLGQHSSRALEPLDSSATRSGGLRFRLELAYANHLRPSQQPSPLETPSHRRLSAPKRTLKGPEPILLR